MGIRAKAIVFERAWAFSVEIQGEPYRGMSRVAWHNGDLILCRGVSKDPPRQGLYEHLLELGLREVREVIIRTHRRDLTVLMAWRVAFHRPQDLAFFELDTVQELPLYEAVALTDARLTRARDLEEPEKPKPALELPSLEGPPSPEGPASP